MSSFFGPFAFSSRSSSSFTVRSSTRISPLQAMLRLGEPFGDRPLEASRRYHALEVMGQKIRTIAGNESERGRTQSNECGLHQFYFFYFLNSPARSHEAFHPAEDIDALPLQ